MNKRNLTFALLLLPLTLLLDLILYAAFHSCPSCASFSQWIKTEGAFSFPAILGFTKFVEVSIAQFHKDRKT
ncbi:hypothetical protein HYW55_05945 [Candidatus Gottesmanbacteria bacterium]|nr:hypothetical protein [Candidatus Gottesmanbacteria bacterium]